MNPPYNQTLHEKFFLKSFDLCCNDGCIVSVEPTTWLFGKRKNKDICNNINKYKSDIELINGIQVFDAEIQCQMSINYINKSIKESSVLFNNKLYESTEDIQVFSIDESLSNLYLAIKQDVVNDNVNNHLKKSWKNKEPDKSLYLVRIPAIRGHMDKNDKSGKLDDFYTVISNDVAELEKTIGTAEDLYYNKNIVKLYFEFDSKSQAEAFLKYIQTYFFRACLALKKKNLHLDSGEFEFIPWQNFNDFIFNKPISEIDDFLFSKYNISAKDINHLKDILKNYYNI